MSAIFRAVALILGLTLGATAQAGGSRAGFAVVVPVGPMAPVVAVPLFSAPAAPVFIAHPVAPMYAPSFAPGFVPGFVPVAPQMVVTPMVVTPMIVTPMVVTPAVPVMAPRAPLFIIPGSGF
jgi:hypothetical protein